MTADQRKKAKVVLLSCAAALALACLEGKIISAQQGVTFWSMKVLRETAAAVVPNFVAGLVAFVFAFFLLRQDDRARYVTAMRKVRGALSALRSTNTIEPHHAQSLMMEIVPAISDLYFEKQWPDPNDEDRATKKASCSLCPIAQPMGNDGRCQKCHDIPACWTPQERTPAQ